MIDDRTDDAVALFVDFEHLQRCLHGLDLPDPAFSVAVEALLERIRERGSLLVANVYADWEEFPGMQTELKRLQLDPRFVLPRSAVRELSLTRGNFSALTLALDALQTLYERQDINTYVLVTGEGGYSDLVGRLKGHRKRVVLMGFERYTCADLRQAVSEFEPLDAYLTVPEAVHDDTPPSPEEYQPGSDRAFDWEPFVLLLNRLEQHLPFVSLKYLKNQVLTPAHGCDNSQDSKANLIREAIRQRYIETFKIPNPRNPNYDTTACRLNRKHHDVKRVLGLSRANS